MPSQTESDFRPFSSPILPGTAVSRTEATVAELLGLLPDLDDLEVLRLRIVQAAVPDPGKAWDSSNDFTTVDKRIVTPEDAERAIEEAGEALRQYVTSLHDALRPVLRSFYAGDSDATARHLIALGESLEASGRLMSARRCYRTALNVSLPLPEKSQQILALRRVARTSLTVGDLEEGASYYERSAQLARDAGDVRSQVVARTGLGNVRMYQGRWLEAEEYYREALMLIEGTGNGDLALERAQLYNNLGNLSTRLRRLDEAETWFEQALRLWHELSSPIDLAICHINHAHLREEQGRWEEAHRMYESALRLDIPSVLRAPITTDLAEWWLHEGHVTQAEEWGRVAEEHAIAAGSPYTLGRMYQARGNIARARGGFDGFTFYEKALEIAREKGYPFLEAETLVDYALLRGRNGGAEEAHAYLERAREIFLGLGALGEMERAERAAQTLGSDLPAGAEPREPAPPLAAAGD